MYFEINKDIQSTLLNIINDYRENFMYADFNSLNSKSSNNINLNMMVFKVKICYLNLLIY